MPSVTTLSMITSVFVLGSWLGALITAIFGIMYGGRTWILLGNLLEIIGALISVTSYGPGQLIAGRILVVRSNTRQKLVTVD